MADNIEIRIQHYKAVPEDATITQQVDHALEHLRWGPCPGCAHAATMLELLRPFAEELDGKDEEPEEEEPPPFA